MFVLDHEAISSSLRALQVPAAFAISSTESDTNTSARLDEWKRMAERVLGEIQALLASNTQEIAIAIQSEIVFTVAPYGDQELWSTPISQEVARTILDRFHPERRLLEHILIKNLRPHFRSNPHPSLNAATGRRLTRPAGGPMATQDFYESQGWKDNPGVSKVLTWVVKHMNSDFYEELWHLIIPPTMTLLDDYEAKYKLEGVRVVSYMLQNVPGSLLMRTGVNGLIRTSLKMSLTHLQAPESRQLIETAARTSVSLTLMTTKPGSVERFNELCDLLGEGIISNVWVYSFDKPNVIFATFNAIPPIIEALGVGAARYLKAVMIQLFHALRPGGLDLKNHGLQMSALRVLSILIRVCSLYLPRWKTAITNVVAKLWVTLADTGSESASANDLRLELRHICEVLGENCPRVRTEEYKKLLSSDPGIFLGLFEKAKAI